MAPNHPETEERSRDGQPIVPGALDLWAAVELWFAAWLVRWRPLTARRLAVSAAEPLGLEDGDVGLGPYAVYRAHAPRMAEHERRWLARHVCACLVAMRPSHMVKRAFVSACASQRVIFARWRRVFRTYVTPDRNVRGDGPLAMAEGPRARGNHNPPRGTLDRIVSGSPGLVPGPLPAGRFSSVARRGPECRMGGFI